MIIPGIIPARRGSGRLRGRNMLRIDGRTLIEIAVSSAAPVLGLDNIYVSTDDPDIAAEARRCGARVVDRPAALSADGVSTRAVALHALDAIIAERGEGSFDAFAYLHATTPLRGGEDIEACIALLRDGAANTVVSIRESEVTPGRVWAMRGGRMLPYFQDADPFRRRQDQQTAFHANGAVHICRLAPFLASRGDSLLVDPCLGYEMPEERSIDIDEPLDHMLARVWMQA